MQYASLFIQGRIIRRVSACGDRKPPQGFRQSGGWVRARYLQSRTDRDSSESHPPPQFTSLPVRRRRRRLPAVRTVALSPERPSPVAVAVASAQFTSLP